MNIHRVQQESSDGAERNRFLVQYIDYLFDDFDGRQPPVYPGLCTVWGSLARSKVSTLFFRHTAFEYWLCLSIIFLSINERYMNMLDQNIIWSYGSSVIFF